MEKYLKAMAGAERDGKHCLELGVSAENVYREISGQCIGIYAVAALDWTISAEDLKQIGAEYSRICDIFRKEWLG